jgi:hypothetical protein
MSGRWSPIKWGCGLPHKGELMSLGWQEAVALVLAAGALVYVLRRVRQAICHKPGTSCGGCAMCPGEEQPSEKLVQLKPKAAP